MGYKIQYGKTMTKTFLRESEHKSIRIPAMKWIIIACVFLLVVYISSAGYLDFLIPGNKEVTTTAFSAMVDDVQNGKSVNAAFTEFCLEILEDAQTK